MNRFARSALLSAAVAATVASPVSDAFAGHRHRNDRNPVITHHGPNNADLIAAGILGIAIGAIIVGAANGGEPELEPRPRPHWDKFPDAPGRDQPRVIRYEDDSDWTPDPWSREWYEACDARYSTFDPSNGTYVAKGGKRRFCTLD
jgi:hypothetical protein